MESTQRIRELRAMFLALAEVIIIEINQGKPIHEIEATTEMMDRIREELQRLESRYS